MKLKNIRYMKKVKGSVLLTVICVMFVMLIIVTATLTLAANASNRAYADYQKNQATYTARSVVNKTIETLQIDATGSADMAENIFDYMDANGGQIELQVNPGEAGALAGGYGTVDRVVLERVGIDDESGYYISGTGESIVKITAHVTMGNKTVTYSQYVTNARSNDNPPSGGSGFISLGGNGGFTSTNGKVYGLAGSNVSANSTDIEKLLNEGIIYDEKFYNSSMLINTKTEFTLPMKKGIAIWGDLAIENSQVTINSDFDTTGNTDIKNIPYLYVDGTLGIKNNIKIGSDTKPVNIFAGRMLSHTNARLELASSVYLYNPSAGGTVDLANLPKVENANENDFSEFDEQPSVTVLGASKGSPLLEWYSGITGSGIGGDLYSLGDVVIKSTNDDSTNPDPLVERRPFTVAGNMYVKGDLHVEEGTLKVIGEFNVDGNITGRVIDSAGNDKTETDTLSFPDNMKKEKITEMNAEDKDSDGVPDIYEPGTDKFIKTKEDMYNSYYENPCADQKTLKGNITKDNFPLVPSIRYNNSIPTTIDKDCAIVGTLSGGTYTFRQPDDGTYKDYIDVLLVNVKTQAGTQFIIDETNYAPNAGDSKFKVNFYIANGDVDGYTAAFGTINNSVQFNKTNILTAYYRDNLLIGSSDFVIDGMPDNITPIPYVNLYGLGATKIEFLDNCIFTGSIFAPESEFTFENSLQINKNITYKRINDEASISNPKISLIGSAIVGKVKEMKNDATVFVVSSDGLQGIDGVDPNFSWTPINGFANY